MIKGEIKTDGMTYSIDLDNFDDVNKAYDHIKQILEGDRVFKNDVAILEIGEAAQIKHIRVFKTALYVPPVEDHQAEGPEDPKGFYEFDGGSCTFLGHKLRLKGQAYEKDGFTYFLPMEINDQPALNVLGRDKLEELTYYWASSQGYDPKTYSILMPAQQLPDYEEAVEYIRDYVAEVEEGQEYEPKAPNAKAWQGWKNEK